MQRPKAASKRSRIIPQRSCWPRIENAFRELLDTRPGQRLTQDDLEHRLFARDVKDEAYAFAIAVTHMVLALQSNAR